MDTRLPSYEKRLALIKIPALKSRRQMSNVSIVGFQKRQKKNSMISPECLNFFLFFYLLELIFELS